MLLYVAIVFRSPAADEGMLPRGGDSYKQFHKMPRVELPEIFFACHGCVCPDGGQVYQVQNKRVETCFERPKVQPLCFPCHAEMCES